MGSTNNLLRRLAEHRRGVVRSTRWRLSVRLVYFEDCQTLERARRREHSLKNGRIRRKTIDQLVATFPSVKLAPFG